MMGEIAMSAKIKPLLAFASTSCAIVAEDNDKKF
jgi:hypothetical protein